jgi:hypothetical protein
MASFIGSMSVLIGANTDPFKKALSGMEGYAKAAAKLTGEAFTKSPTTTLTKGLISWKDAFKSIGGSLLDAIGSPLKTSAVLMERFNAIGTNALLGLASGVKSLGGWLSKLSFKGVGESLGRMTAGAKDKLGSLIPSLSGVLKNPLDGIGNIFSGLNFSSVLSGGFSLLSGAVTGVAYAFSAAMSVGSLFLNLMQELMGVVKAGAARIDEIGTAAMRSGVAMKDFVVFKEVVGDIDLAARSMTKFNVTLGQAATEGPRADNAFTRLGLNAAELSKMPATQSLGLLADKLNGITNRAVQAEMASKIFGRTWGTIMPLIQQGSARINKKSGLVEKFGLEFDENDFAQVKKLKEAQKTITNIKDGLTNQLTLASIPFITAFAEWFASLNNFKLDGLKNTFFDAFAGVMRFGAGVYEVLSDTSMIRESFDLLGDYIVDTLRFSFVKVAKSIRFLMPGSNLMTDEQTDALLKAGGHGKEFDKTNNKFNDFINKVKSGETWKKADKLADKLKATMNKAPEAGGNEEDLIALAKRTMDLRKELANPLDVFDDKFADLKDLSERLSRVKGGINPQTEGLLNQSFAKAFQTLQGAVKLPEMKNAGAVQQGSQEAYSAILKFRQGDGVMNAEETLKAMLEQVKIQNEIQERNGREARAAYEKLGNPVAKIPK